MDLRDFQILLELNRHPFSSPGAIGKALGVTGNAVKARLDRMKAEGLLNGFFVMPVSAVFGRHWHVFPYLDVEPEPDLQEILDVEDVVNVWRGRPRTIMVNTYSRTRGGAPSPKLAEVLHCPPSGVALPDAPNRFSANDAVLSPLDWRVIEALLDRPRAPLADLARATQLSPRTVRKRRDSLVSKGLLGIIPNLDTSRESGLIVYSGHVATKTRADLDRLHLPGLSVLRQLFDPPAAWVIGHAATYAELQQVELKLLSIPGVISAQLVPSRGGALATERLRGWIQDELRAWKNRRSEPVH